MESRTQLELPSQVVRPFEVFVNGVLQVEGRDYEQVGSSLVFPRMLVRERRLGFWRWLLIVIGVAGSYGQNDTVDVVSTVDGNLSVTSLVLQRSDEWKQPDGGTLAS